jgi:hypothetical protein
MRLGPLVLVGYAAEDTAMRLLLAVRARAGRVTGRALERGRDEARPTPRPPPPTELHKLYELVVASYLKNGAS